MCYFENGDHSLLQGQSETEFISSSISMNRLRKIYSLKSGLSFFLTLYTSYYSRQCLVSLWGYREQRGLFIFLLLVLLFQFSISFVPLKVLISGFFRCWALFCTFRFEPNGNNLFGQIYKYVQNRVMRLAASYAFTWVYLQFCPSPLSYFL